ncbi:MULTISPECIES: class I SAM-dependent methyltransferase [Bacillaceae]|uniref:Class I SAM-dependent methyltransferase n=1 Tax=Evansella alkalicola TaxID=745819 RepID=A0ABS6JRI0_9BACI|nr:MULTISPECIES: class I SAM-dependent methyltransferase [Bacillaceae]MBU9721030.1 class I SAM-dependent methyltransferase [Bacillus alkalicola]
MDFYTTLSTYYDDIFKLNKKAVSFIGKVMNDKQGQHILDLGAGTGEEAIAFARKGMNVVATDNNELMVKNMQQKASELSLSGIETLQLDMKDISLLPHTNSFDAIYCIGNTFVHLFNEIEMVKVLNDCYSRLKPGGNFIIQIVNYDRIIEENITELPKINNADKGIEFQRFYEKIGENLSFKMKLSKKQETGKTITFESKTKLLPIKMEDFHSILQKSNFTNWEFHGSYNFEKWSIDSPALIAVIKR